jgi:hypothetical protein
MRGSDESIGLIFVYVTTAQFVPKHHPLRMAPCWNLLPQSRASDLMMTIPTNLPVTSREKSSPEIRIAQPLILTPGSTRKAKVHLQNFQSWVMP